MSPEDTVLCQEAITQANAGQKYQAYSQFSVLLGRNPNDVTLNYWIAYTTPSPEEAQRAVATIARFEPMHPRLIELEAYVSRKQRRMYDANAGPVLQCPYCHYAGPVRIVRKISVGGWVWFAAFFAIGLGFEFALGPAAQAATMGCVGFFFLLAAIVGLFVIKKRSYTCSNCRIVLGGVQ